MYRYEIDSAASPPCYRLTERGNEDKGDEERRVLAVFQKVLSVELRDAYLTTVVEQVRKTLHIPHTKYMILTKVCFAGST